MFDQQADETLHRTKGRAVDHDRPVRFVVRPGVMQIETLRQLEVDLHRAELPLAADHVADHKINLRPVERGLTGLFAVRHPERPGRLAAGLLGSVPILRRAHVFARPRFTQPEAHAVILHVEGAENFFTRSRQPWISAPIWSSVTNKCASSWVNPRTRVMPFNSPDCSQR